MSVNLDSIAKVLAIPTTLIALVAAWKALPVDAEIKELQVQTQKLDIELRSAEGRLKEAESLLKETEAGRKLSFDLYQEVRRTLDKKDRTPKEEEALRVLIEALAVDPFRYRLLDVLAVSASSPETKQLAFESSTFFKEEASISALIQSATKELRLPQSHAKGIGDIDVDVFYCASKIATSEPTAKKILELQQPNEEGRWRLRLLPESINKQSGYGISSNQIRYNPPYETEAAKSLLSRMEQSGYKAELRQSQQSTEWYVSVFICE
jgi:hypothetical protein